MGLALVADRGSQVVFHWKSCVSVKRPTCLRVIFGCGLDLIKECRSGISVSVIVHMKISESATRQRAAETDYGSRIQVQKVHMCHWLLDVARKWLLLVHFVFWF